MTDQDDKNSKIVETLEDVPMGLLAPPPAPPCFSFPGPNRPGARTIEGEKRFALANEMVQWTIASDERREPMRAAGRI
jgi:hypothetical protein